MRAHDYEQILLLRQLPGGIVVHVAYLGFQAFGRRSISGLLGYPLAVASVRAVKNRQLFGRRGGGRGGWHGHRRYLAARARSLAVEVAAQPHQLLRREARREFLQRGFVEAGR